MPLSQHATRGQADGKLSLRLAAIGSDSKIARALGPSLDTCLEGAEPLANTASEIGRSDSCT